MSARLVSKEGICAYLGDISPSTYDSWHAKGIVPGPLRGTSRYDIRAHDAALDKASGLDSRVEGKKMSPLEEWVQSHAA